LAKKAKIKISLSDNPKESRVNIDGMDITHCIVGLQLNADAKKKALVIAVQGDIWVEGRIPTSLFKMLEPVPETEYQKGEQEPIKEPVKEGG